MSNNGGKGLAPNKPVEIGQFGQLCYWTGNKPKEIENHVVKSKEDNVYQPVQTDEMFELGIEWEESRHIHKVVVEYDRGDTMPALGEIKIEYWHNTWPAENNKHWTDIDDKWNGEWINAHIRQVIEGRCVIYTFDPLDINELEKAEDFAVFYRKTLKLRLLFKENLNIKNLEVYSDSVWRSVKAEVIFREDEEPLNCETEVYNGFMESSQLNNNKYSINVWYTSTPDREGEQTTAGTYPDHQYSGRWPYDGGSPDRTVVTIINNRNNFSFLPGDLAAGKIIEIPDLGVKVNPVDVENIDSDYGVSSEIKSATEGKSIYNLIDEETEQTFSRATAEIPALQKTKQEPWGRYVCLGYEANRQEFALRFNGHVYLNKKEMKVSQRDTANLLWPGMEMRYKFGTGDPVDFREREDATRQSLLDGSLPVVISEWEDRGIAFEQEAFSALIEDTPENEETKSGDESTILLMKLKMRNTTPKARPAKLWFVVEPGEYLSYDGGYVKAEGRYVHDHTIEKGWWRSPYQKARMRAYLNTNDRGSARAISYSEDNQQSAERSGAILYEVDLQGRESHTIEFKIPFETYTEAEIQKKAAAVNYNKKREGMVAYWRSLISENTNLEVPNKTITDFQKAVIPHIAISVDKDVDSGLYMVPAGTYRYNVCSNEACMQIHMLDLFGYHKRARNYLETFLKCQGSRPLHGKFKSQKGVLHGLRVSEDFDYQTFNYNLDHGWIMYTCAEHYNLTSDKQWLKKWADNLVAAADFVTRERKTTMRRVNGKKVREYGLLPAGHLEDNPEWFYWYSVNGYTWRGVQTVAEVLNDIDHPEADRLLKDARLYKEDIVNSINYTKERAPVVPLRDGTYIPHSPTRAYLRGRDLGWIRENLYGMAHMVETGIFADDSQEATWILKDYEDNLFVNPAYSRFVDVEKDWFSHGGMSIQAHLLYNPLIYLRRDQIKHALRAYFNSLVSHLYPDVRCFTEHAVEELGHGVGPFYKTPDEAGSVTWLRHLLVHEQNGELLLGWGIPRKWLEDGERIQIEHAPTHFGEISYNIKSEVNQKQINVELNTPVRKQPVIKFRIRHPQVTEITDIIVEGCEDVTINRGNECIKLENYQDKVKMVFKYE